MITKWELVNVCPSGRELVMAVEDSQERIEQRRIQVVRYLAENCMVHKDGAQLEVREWQFEDNAAVTEAEEQAARNWFIMEDDVRKAEFWREIAAKYRTYEEDYSEQDAADAAEEQEHDAGVAEAERECQRIDEAQRTWTRMWELRIYGDCDPEESWTRTLDGEQLASLGWFGTQSAAEKERDHINGLMKEHGLVFDQNAYLSVGCCDVRADKLEALKSQAANERDCLDEKIWALVEGQGITCRSTASLMVVPGPDFKEPKPKAVTTCR